MGILKKQIWDRTWKAATLVEILVALLIISIVFTITLNILLKVTQSGYNLSKIKAIQETKKVSIITMNEKRYLTEEIPFEGFIIKKSINSYATDSCLSELTIGAYSPDGKLIYQQKEIVNTNEE